MKIYVASSWKNPVYETLLESLREKGYSPLDWKEDGGFSWKQTGWNPDEMLDWQFRDIVLQHPRAIEGFQSDFKKMNEADCCVLLLPCGRSAHFEAGWFWGAGKPIHIYIPIFDTPELMYKGATSISFSLSQLLSNLGPPSLLSR